MKIKANLPRYPDPSRVDGGRPPQSATFREAGKSFDFYACIVVTFSDGVKQAYEKLKTSDVKHMKLETERLILRDFVKEDWQRVMEYQSDPLYLRYNHWTERTPDAVQEFVGWFLAHQQQEPRIKFQLAVVLKSKDLLIGNCGVRKDQFDSVEADIGYELDPKHWNQGYATEATSAIVDFGFSHFGVHRIWAACVADNVGSAHVLDKLGMKLEGRFRENRYYKDRWWDSLYYAILADEWEAHKQSHPVQWKEIKE